MTNGQILAVTITAILVTLAILFWNKISGLIEPDPTTVKTAYVEEMINTAGAHASIDRLLYINSDYMAYIFEGDVQAPDEGFRWTQDDLFGHRLEEEQYSAIFATRDGLLAHTVKADGKHVWGLVISTTSGEWAQGEPMFERKWKEIVTPD